MWSRLRIDIPWRDVGFGALASLLTGKRRDVQTSLECEWSKGAADSLAALSVRSGFDLLLQVLELPAGSEVLFSAITIRDLPKITREHGLVPVPIDVAGADFHLDMESLRAALTPQSRVLVVAQLFGARVDLNEVVAFAHEHNLLIVEDCAQAWFHADWRGDEQADVSLFSFGSIKTATAFGGALCRVKNQDLLARMRSLQSLQPVQRSSRFSLKCIKYGVIKALSTRWGFSGLIAFARGCAIDIDQLLGNITKGFSGQQLLTQLRHQPSTGLLSLLRRRLRSYDGRLIERRIRNARRIISNLQLETSHSELMGGRHCFWLFPYSTDDPQSLVSFLRKHSYDTTRNGRLELVPVPSERPDCVLRHAPNLFNNNLLLPCYAELTDSAIDKLCQKIRDFESEHSAAKHSVTEERNIVAT